MAEVQEMLMTGMCRVGLPDMMKNTMVLRLDQTASSWTREPPSVIS